MITELRLKNFRGIKEGEIELAPLTLLLGGNNSGKSTILEALFLAPNPFRRIPYLIGGSTAIEVVYSVHKTLSSEGHAFLLYNYTASSAELSCKIDGEDLGLQFTKVHNEKIEITGKHSTIHPKEKKETTTPTSLGGLEMSTGGFSFASTNLLMDNTLLISSIHSVISLCA